MKNVKVMENKLLLSVMFAFLLSNNLYAASVVASCTRSGQVPIVYTSSIYTQCSTTSSAIPTHGTEELTSTAFASANLSTGELKATSSIESTVIPGTSGGAVSGTAIATMYDKITILGDWIGELSIPLTMYTDGRFYNHVGQGIGGTAYMQITGQDPSFAGTSQLITNWDGLTNTVTTDSSGSNGDFNINVISSGISTFQSELTLNFIVTQENPVISFRARLQTSGGSIRGTDGISVIDFGNTSGLGLTLPENITYTSESGVFLTAVPVPSAVWLFGSGLIGLIGFARRKIRYN